ncbi:hypothetical protein EDD18DRAFT_1106039 [Armillaria luteobubalina]|uniref:Uncharacterized protein n=1 Tax=Armillaria luteobubalina TaxID=153913 RepID=A0AA39Q6E3_9AGAR|nr:hypothetical protein EDD18DRAFT_1106039 [Armillaria luteobubalina]
MYDSPSCAMPNILHSKLMFWQMGKKGAKSKAKMPSIPTTSTVNTSESSTASATTLPLCHKNHWTNSSQLQFLVSLIPDYTQTSASGTLSDFKVNCYGTWHDRWPETKGCFFLDRSGAIWAVPVHLLGVNNSPPDSPFPKMVGSTLDLGPEGNLDGCEIARGDDTGLNDLDDSLAEIATALGTAIEERHRRLENWFSNNKPGRHRRGGNLVKFLLAPPRLSQAVHKYSKMYYTNRVLPHIIQEAEDCSVWHNDLKLVKEMTAHAWANEDADIKASVFAEIEREKKVMESSQGAGNDLGVVLTDDEQFTIIESLQHELNDKFKHVAKFIPWRFVVIAGGYNPHLGSTDGKDFIKSFDAAAAAGCAPGTLPGDRRCFSEYFGVPFMHHVKKMHREDNHTSKGPSTSESDDLGLVNTGAGPAMRKEASVLAKVPLMPLISTSSSKLPVPEPVPPPSEVPLPSIPTFSSILEQANLPTEVSQLSMRQLVEQTPTSFHISSESASATMPLQPIQPPDTTRILCQQILPTTHLISSNVDMPVGHTSPQSQPLFLPGSPDAEDIFPQWNSDFSSDDQLPWQSAAEASTSELQGLYSFSGDLPSSGQSFDSVLGTGLNFASPDWTLDPSWLQLQNITLPHTTGTQWPHSMVFGNPVLTECDASVNMTQLPLTISSISSTTTAESSSIVPNAPSPNMVLNLHAKVLLTDAITNINPPPNGASRSNATATNPDAGPALEGTAPKAPASAITSIPTPPSIPAPPDVSNTSHPSQQCKPPRPKEVTTLSGSGKEKPPAWIIDCKELLGDGSFGEAWLNLVEKWHQLELDIWSSDSSPAGKLLLKCHPRLLTLWLNGPRSFEQGPSIPELSRFDDNMVSWWNQLNPAWRRSTTGLPKANYSKSLMTLCKGGQHGLVTVVFGLYWWRRWIGTTSDTNIWLQMVDEVEKVIDSVFCADSLSTLKQGQKCSNSDGDLDGNRKHVKV